MSQSDTLYNLLKAIRSGKQATCGDCVFFGDLACYHWLTTKTKPHPCAFIGTCPRGTPDFD